jgi:hypothetical protein
MGFIKNKRLGVASYIGLSIMVIIFTLTLMIVIAITPVFITKQSLDTYAMELVRTAEIYGQIGTETDARAAELSDELGISPAIMWNRAPGRVQLGGKISVRLTTDEILEFSTFARPSITLSSQSSGRSEVYWKTR